MTVHRIEGKRSLGRYSLRWRGHMDLSSSGYNPLAGYCEHGAKSSGYMKGEEFLDLLNEYQFLKNDSTQ
jgi:hypothetical protein